MNIEEAEKFMNSLETKFEIIPNTFYKGLSIFAKYLGDKEMIGGADHDIVYGPMYFEEITEDDLRELRRFGWHLETEHDCWAHFV